MSLRTDEPVRTKPVLTPPKPAQSGAGLSFKDGLNFGMGFGVAITIVLPIILMVIACAAVMFLAAMGQGLGGL